MVGALGMKTLLRDCFRRTYGLRVFYLRSRYELPFVLNSMNLVGEGVELGVQLGHFSASILSAWQGACLNSVDPWREFPQTEYEDASNVSQVEQDRIFNEATARLEAFGSRSRVLRMTSQEAAPLFRAGQLDFVYIDAQHHYEAARDDIETWYPKVRKGGILAGHDYLEGEREAGYFGVKRAVDEFVARRGLRLVVSAEGDWPSWFVFC